MNHCFACRKDASGEPPCKQWCGRPDLCLSTLTYPEDYMQSAYEHGLRDGLDRAAKNNGSDRGVLEARLAECLSEREARQKRGWGYGQSVSDHWLERDIAALQRMLAPDLPDVQEPRFPRLDVWRTETGETPAGVTVVRDQTEVPADADDAQRWRFDATRGDPETGDQGDLVPVRSADPGEGIGHE